MNDISRISRLSDVSVFSGGGQISKLHLRVPVRSRVFLAPFSPEFVLNGLLTAYSAERCEMHCRCTVTLNFSFFPTVYSGNQGSVLVPHYKLKKQNQKIKIDNYLYVQRVLSYTITYSDVYFRFSIKYSPIKYISKPYSIFPTLQQPFFFPATTSIFLHNGAFNCGGTQECR